MFRADAHRFVVSVNIEDNCDDEGAKENYPRRGKQMGQILMADPLIEENRQAVQVQTDRNDKKEKYKPHPEIACISQKAGGGFITVTLRHADEQGANEQQEQQWANGDLQSYGKRKGRPETEEEIQMQPAV